ncbi:MAG TPA: monofunctional biosynthetic peptidoglycan transglycosylase [Bryobacteraceae bacterium]|nr:monofunctional biosynthetic peptidoglycan transglycosylase [Bryobacteraceae bacterium]
MKLGRQSVKKKRRSGRLARVLGWSALVLLVAHLLCAIALAGLRFVNPPTTGVQIQRRVGSLIIRGKYEKRQTFVPLSRIAPDLQHAVIAAEDGRFYEHGGIDWKQVRIVAEDSLESGEVPRGASTIPQQLVKNLFFTTHRNPLRKAAEYTLAPMADVILGKQRTLELYLNVAEWGPGIFGAEAAAYFHYGVSASRLSREQAARLAAILPAPVRRKPGRMNGYSSSIQTRMRQMGW